MKADLEAMAKLIRPVSPEDSREYARKIFAGLDPAILAAELLSVQPMTEVEGDAVRVLTKEPGQA